MVPTTMNNASTLPDPATSAFSSNTPTNTRPPV